MSETYIAYACARVRRAPTSSKDVLEELAIKRQLSVIQSAARQRRLTCALVRVDVSTTAGTKFIERPKFLDVLAQARARGATLVIEDVGSILRHLDAKNAGDCAIALASLDVPLLEASTQQYLNTIDQSVLRARIAMACLDRAMRGKRVSDGITTRRSRGVTRAATIRASRSRTQLSRENAARLAPMIQEIEAARVGGEPLNANAMFNALNERGIKAPRGGLWTYDSAARLLKLYRVIEAHKGRRARSPEAPTDTTPMVDHS